MKQCKFCNDQEAGMTCSICGEELCYDCCSLSPKGDDEPVCPNCKEVKEE